MSFDFETGHYKDFCIRYKRFTDGIWMLDKHPDTKEEWRTLGLPNREMVRKQIDSICQYVSSLDYMGLDIIITENGTKLCEINSHPAIDYEQIMCGPTLARPKVKEFFEHKGLRKQDPQAFYRAYRKVRSSIIFSWQIMEVLKCLKKYLVRLGEMMNKLEQIMACCSNWLEKAGWTTSGQRCL